MFQTVVLFSVVHIVLDFTVLAHKRIFSLSLLTPGMDEQKKTAAALTFDPQPSTWEDVP